jgi:hypothetical protein
MKFMLKICIILVSIQVKRRGPRSYRTSGYKSYTQVLRDLIQTQMEVLNLGADENESTNRAGSNEKSPSKQHKKKRRRKTRSPSLTDDESNHGSYSKKRKSKKSKKQKKHKEDDRKK